MVAGRVGRVEASGNSRCSRTETGRAGAMRARDGTSIALRDAMFKALFDKANAPMKIHLQFSAHLSLFALTAAAAGGGGATAAVSARKNFANSCSQAIV